VSRVIKFPLSPLGRVIDEHQRALGCTKKSLTVLSAQNDPFRADSRRPAAQWFAELFSRFYGENRTAHIRGMHYRIVSAGNIVKPNGETFINTEKDWDWLCTVSTDARYLGLVPFDRIIDNGFTDPIIREHSATNWVTSLQPTFNAWRFDADEDIGLDPSISGFRVPQPYQLVLFGEKSSLAEIVQPMCDRFGASMYLSSGELSLTHVHSIARRAVDDDKPVVFFTVCDADPSGWQMPISIARKLRGLLCGFMPTLQYRVIRVGLTPKQADQFDLPSTPLKETEKRGDQWELIMSRAQTEVDAMISLHPNELRQMVQDAMAPYFDESLTHRVWMAEGEWGDEARRWIDNQVGREMAALRQEAEERLSGFNQTIVELRDRFEQITEGIELPEPELPEPELDDEPTGNIIADSRWTYLKETKSLKADKAYEIDDEDEAA
jgi:hypothetical protein